MRWWRLVSLGAVCAWIGWGQTSGSLAGAAVDPQGAAIPEAAVRLYLPGGEQPVAATESTTEGLFHFTGLRPRRYDLQVEAPGFLRETVRGVKVDAARTVTIPTITLPLGSVVFSVEVSAELESLQGSTADVSVTVDSEQIRRLPLLDRNPLRLVSTQAGVGANRAQGTVINGQRPSFTNITFDGANIQDNFARSNGVDFTPNFLVLDQVAEFTVTTSNSNASAGGGASQINYVSPSGANTFHGSGYWSHRNNALAANDWFANADSIERASFAQNQVGFTLSGPIKRDRLLFFQSLEIFRLPQRRQQFRTILTETARQGIFSYLTANGAVRTFDPRDIGVPVDELIDPVMQSLLERVPGPEKINNFRLGDSREGVLLNTAGYSFFASNDLKRFNTTSRLDYLPSSDHAFSASLNFSKATQERSDVLNNYTETPPVVESRTPKLVSGNWRWNPTPQFTNELRTGFNFAPIHLDSSEDKGAFVFEPIALVFDNPVNLFATEKRDTNTWHFQDNAGYVAGVHHLQFGFQMTGIGVRTEDEIDIVPRVTVRGVSITDIVRGLNLTQANTAAFLYGDLFAEVASMSQAFNVTGRDSGFVPRQARIRHYRHANYAWYVQDDWRIAPRLTLNLGLRHEILTPVNEREGLAVLPVGAESDALGTLLSNATLDFAGSSVGRPFHALDKNNFAPYLGAAWDISGTGRTVLRGGYSIHYVNDETIRTSSYVTQASEGLNRTVTVRRPLGDPIYAAELGPDPIPTPEFQMPLTLREGFETNSLQAVGLIDPNLRTPFVHEWSLGVQRKLGEMIVEARYVGNRGLRLIRSLDFNFPLLRENGFLEDFLRAKSNGELAFRRTGFFDPSFNPAIAGSAELTIFPQLGEGGLLDNDVVLDLLRSGQAGDLALFYQVTGLGGPIQFMSNPLVVSSFYLTNSSSSIYHSLQLDLRRRLRNGLQFQGNYTFGKVLSDAVGTESTRFDPYLDARNGEIEKARAPFDLNHAIKANFIWELPFYRESRQPAAAWFGGWSFSGVLTWQSGAPFSIVSGRGTLNTSSYSALNTVDTLLDKEQLDALLDVRATGAGPSFLDPSAIDADGQGSPDLFANPQPGHVGSLQRRQFSGPWTFNLDFAVLKTIQFSERNSVEFRAEASNLFNNSSWVVGDQNINQQQFGRIRQVAYDSRRIQLGIYYRF